MTNEELLVFAPFFTLSTSALEWYTPIKALFMRTESEDDMDYTINTAQEKVLIEKASQQLNDRLIDELVAIRKEMDLTQQDISDKTGINRANVACIENKKHITSMEVLVKYANCLDKDIRVSLVDRQ